MKRNWFFFALKMLPLAVCILGAFGGLSVDLTNSWLLPAVEPFYGILETLCGVINFDSPVVILRYCSWLMFIDFIRIFYSVVMFLPEWAISAFERWSK